MPALSDSNPAVGILEVCSSRQGDTTTLALKGELDLASIDLVRERIDEAKCDDSSRIVIDLRELTFIDSTGISLLLSTIKQDSEARFGFIPCESPAVRRVFSVTGVIGVFGG